MKAPHVVVIGGGIVGLALARTLAASGRCAVTVLEKEAGIARHQSTHNSGVLHAGLHYKPGSLKARLAVEGLRRMLDFCVEHGIKHEQCGKLVIATDESEVPRLRDLYERGTQNGLQRLEWLSAEQIAEHEPNATGVCAVRVPEEGIVDYAQVCTALGADLRKANAVVHTGARVTGVRPTNGAWVLETTAGAFEADYFVNCAGLHADRVAQLAGERTETLIVPFRGSYFTLRADRAHLVRGLIYPVPDPAFPFLGVHLTRRISGAVDAGPNAVLATAREGYRASRVVVRDMFEAVTFPGLWRFLFRHPRAAANEVVRGVSRRVFANDLARLVPDIRADDLEDGPSGVRAQAMSRNGELIHDFVFVERPNALHVLNAPSPAATASLAIAEQLRARIETALRN